MVLRNKMLNALLSDQALVCALWQKMTTKIYTASGWPFRASIARINAVLNAIQGLRVISTWVENEDGNNEPTNMGRDAQRDTDQVGECDVLLAIMNDPTYAYRGTNVEIGYALGRGKRVIIVCAGLGQERQVTDTHYDYPYNCTSNVFFWHPSITRVSTLEDAILLLVGKTQ